MKKIIIAGIICILMLIACFSPWRGGDFGTFSIITGSGDNGRKVWNDTDTNDLIHDILVIDSAGKEYSQKGIIGAQGVPFTVTPGPCNISVLAIMYEDDGESEILQAVGSRTVNINPGKNSTVSISMGEPNGEDYCKVIFKLGDKTINRYVHAGQKVTVPKTFRDMKQILDAGLYRGTFYDDVLSFVEYGKWYKGTGLFDVANVSITEDITLKGEWDKWESLNVPSASAEDKNIIQKAFTVAMENSPPGIFLY